MAVGAVHLLVNMYKCSMKKKKKKKQKKKRKNAPGARDVSRLESCSFPIIPFLLPLPHSLFVSMLALWGSRRGIMVVES